MRGRLIVASVALALLCAAKFILYTGATAPSYTGPGDIVSGATAWYGLRAYNAAYATAGNNAINVRNTATNETCTVPVVSTGGLGNVASCSGSSSGDTLATFCAESSGTCAVTEAFDQSGANACSSVSCNISQGTAADQPNLVLNCVNSLPCIQGCSGCDLTKATFATVAQPITLSTVMNRTGNFTTKQVVFANGSVSVGAQYQSSANTILVLAGANQSCPNENDSVWHAVIGVFNGSSGSGCYSDGSNTSSSSGSNSLVAANGVALLAQANGGSPGLAVEVEEAGFWPAEYSSGNKTSVCENQQAYYGTGNFQATC